MSRTQRPRVSRLSACAAAVLVLAAGSARAADLYWTCGSSNPWGSAECWSNGIGPFSTDDAYLSGNATKDIVVQYKEHFDYSVNNLFVGAFIPYSSVSLQQTGGRLTTEGSVIVGSAAYNAKLSISGGSLVDKGALLVGVTSPAGTTSTFSISGPSTVTVGAGVTLGNTTGSNGVVRQSGGSLTTTYISLAGPASSYQLSGGTLSVTQALIGTGAASGLSFLSLSGLGSVSANALFLGSAQADGEVRHSFGTMTTQQISLASAGSSYKMSGGTLNAGSGLTITGKGWFNFTGGTISSSSIENFANMKIGAGLAVGKLTNDANATLQLNGGTLGGSGNLYNRGAITGSGKVEMRVANTGTVTVSGGDLAFSHANGLDNQGRLAISGQHKVQTTSGTSWTNVGTVDLGGRGTLAVGGVFENRGTLVNGGSVAAGSVVNRGSIRADSSRTLTLAGAIDNRGSIVVAPTSANPARTGTLDGATITNQSGASVGGSGTILNAVVNLAGGTYSVDAQGKLLQQGNYDARAGSTTQLGDGATLTFGGQTSFADGVAVTGEGHARITGRLRVGGGIGSATIQGDATFEESSVYVAGFGDEALNAVASKLVVGDRLTVNGGTLTLVSGTGFVAKAGQTFDLFDFGSERGRFDDIDTSGLRLARGTRLDLQNLYVDGTISVISGAPAVAAVPEPASWATLGAGLAMLMAGGLRNRRRAQAAAPM